MGRWVVGSLGRWALWTLAFLVVASAGRGQVAGPMTEREAEGWIQSFQSPVNGPLYKRVVTEGGAALAGDIGSGAPLLAQYAITEAKRRHDPALIGALATRLADRRSESLSTEAALALGSFGGTAARAALRRGLRDPRLRVRSEAGIMLAHYGERAAIPALRDALGVPDTATQIAAASGLARLHDLRSAGRVRLLMEQLNPAERRRLCTALARFGDPALLRKLEAMVARESYAGTRAHAASALGIYGNRAAMPTLVRALEDRASDVRCAAAEALAIIGDASAVPALKREARSDAPDTRNAPHMDAAAREAARRAAAMLSHGGHCPIILPRDLNGFRLPLVYPH